MNDLRSAASWRSVRAVQRTLRREAELRVAPDVEIGIVKMCAALMLGIVVALLAWG